MQAFAVASRPAASLRTPSKGLPLASRIRPQKSGIVLIPPFCGFALLMPLWYHLQQPKALMKPSAMSKSSSVISTFPPVSSETLPGCTARDSWLIASETACRTRAFSPSASGKPREGVASFVSASTMDAV